MFSSGNSALQVSLYRNGLGALMIDSGHTDFSNSPINYFEQLDRLQYEGNINCCHFHQSSVNHSFSSLCFLEKKDQAIRVAKELIDYVINSASNDLSMFVSEKSLASILSITSL